MKKTACFALVFAFFLFAAGDRALAREDDPLANVEDAVEYEAFLDAIPPDTYDFMAECGLDPSVESPAPGLREVASFVLRVLASGIRETVPLFSVGIALLVLFKLLGALSVNPTLSGALAFLAVVSSGVYSFSAVERLLDSVSACAERSSSFLSAALPVLCSLQVWSGSPEGAAAIAASFPFSLAAISFLISAVFDPLCRFCFAASLLPFGRSPVSPAPLVSAIKRICVRGVELCSGIAVGVFCLQRLSVSSATVLSRRSTRLALSRLIPVAGGVLSDGLETVYSCGESLRGKVGVLCVMVFLSFFVVPCLLGLLLTLLYSVLASVGECLGVRVLGEFFSSLRDTVSIVASFSLCSLIVLSCGILLLLGG